MVFQSFLPVLLARGLQTKVSFKNERSDPLLNYMQFVFLPFIRRHCGVKYDFNPSDLNTRNSGADVELTIHPPSETLPTFNLLDRGKVCNFMGIMWGNMTKYATVCLHAISF